MNKPLHKALLPGSVVNGQPATLGVMGGGQLGRMFVHAAQAMGYFTAVLDPDAASPAGLVSHHHIQTDYLDEQGLAQLMPGGPQRRCRGHCARPRCRKSPLRALRRAGGPACGDRHASPTGGRG